MATGMNGPGVSSFKDTDPVQSKSDEQDTVEDEDVLLRRNSKVIRQSRAKERTPTAVVSEVFSFLTHNPSVNLEDVDELDIDDVQRDHVYSNLNSCGQGLPGLANEDAAYNGFYDGQEKDRFLAGFQSKDSGFASLERQIGDEGPGSLYESYIDAEDGTEEEVADPTAAIYDNNATGGGSGDGDSHLTCNGGDEDNVYDDVRMSAIGKSDGMSNSSSHVDSENENSIATTAENFSDVNTKLEKTSESASVKSEANKLNTTDSKCQKNPAVIEKNMNASHAGLSSINIGTNTQTQAKSDSYENITTKETSSDGVYANTKDASDGDVTDNAQSCLNDSTLLHSKEATEDNLYEQVIKIDLGNYKPHPTDKDTSGNDTGVSSEGDKSPFAGKDSLDISAMASLYGDAHYENTGALTTSVSSDDIDNEDDHSDKDTPPDIVRTVSGNEETYDTIEMDTQGADLRKEAVENSHKAASKDMDGVASIGSAPGSSDTTDAGKSDLQRGTQSGVPISAETTNEAGSGKVTRRPKLEKNPSAEIGSDDSSDEDVGIYAESFRRSNWIRVSREGKLELTMPSSTSSQSSSSSSPLRSLASMSNNACGSISESFDDATVSPRADEVFSDPLSQAAAKARLFHKRSDSMTTTVSEKEFKNEYITRRKCLIQRADSQHEYHRLSARVYDQDKQVVVERISGCDDLGLHLLDSHPAFITSVDPGSAAEKAGICEGQILVSINEQNVLTTDHADIVDLIQKQKGSIKLGVANSDFQPVRDLQAVVMSGYMYKLGNSSFMKIWKKRYFVLRQDNCLYYYKNDQELDPLGALPLCGYTISRHTDTSKDYCFKADKYRARTYYFMTDNRDQLTSWVGALTEAAARSKKRKESFLSVSSHNVGLPALDIRKPECTGFLGKLSPSKRSWRRRYCVLKDACVYYYKDVNSLSALGVVHLHGYKVDVENYSRRKFSFSLQPPEKKMRVFSFSADNETDKKRWVESLIHSIQRWVQVDKEADC